MNRVLLDQVSANTVSESLDITGGSVILIVRADDFDGGLVSFQVASNNDSELRFATLDNGVFSSNSTVRLENLPTGLLIKAELSGAGGSADKVFAEVKQ